MENLADKLELIRYIVANYLKILRTKGKFHFTIIGRTKLWKHIADSANFRILKPEDLDDIFRIEGKIERENDHRNQEINELL